MLNQDRIIVTAAHYILLRGDAHTEVQGGWEIHLRDASRNLGISLTGSVLVTRSGTVRHPSARDGWCFLGVRCPRRVGVADVTHGAQSVRLLERVLGGSGRAGWES
jgi:hypothetical protein